MKFDKNFKLFWGKPKFESNFPQNTLYQVILHFYYQKLIVHGGLIVMFWDTYNIFSSNLSHVSSTFKAIHFPLFKQILVGFIALSSFKYIMFFNHVHLPVPSPFFYCLCIWFVTSFLQFSTFFLYFLFLYNWYINYNIICGSYFIYSL
jgi:hypothetical protein